MEDDYRKPQKAKATFFLKRLNSPAWISFALFTLDVLEMLSCISLISQKKNIGIHEIEDSIQHAVGRLERFLQNPDTGKRFKTRELFGASDIDDLGVRLHFGKKLKEDLQQRCRSDFPPVFAEATCLLNASAWKFDNFFRAVNSGGKLYSQFQVTPVYNLNVENLVSDIGIKTQLEKVGSDVDAVITEWETLKKQMSRWGRTTFPPMNREVIGAKVGDNAFENLF